MYSMQICESHSHTYVLYPRILHKMTLNTSMKSTPPPPVQTPELLIWLLTPLQEWNSDAN